MLSKFGLIVVLTAGFVVTVLTTGLYATPLAIVELTKIYQPKTPGKVDPTTLDGDESSTPTLAMTAEQMCSHINQDTPGSCIPNADLGDGLGNYKVYKTRSTVAIRDVTIDFPAWMSDDDIAKALQKNLPAGIRYDIWHAVPNGGKRD
jgi:hypothetical protein